MMLLPRLLHLPAFCTLALLTCACAPSTPRLHVADPVWNAGVLVTGSVRERPVELANTGAAPLIIEKIEECCGFHAKGQFPLTIPPGGQFSLPLELNLFKMIGDLNAELTVVSNDPRHPRFPLMAVGHVVPKVYALAELTERRLDLGLVEVGARAPFALRVANPGNTPLVPRAVERGGAVSEAVPLAPIPAGGSADWSFLFVPRGPGPIEETLVVSTNDALNRTLSVQLRGYVVPRNEERHGLLISPVGQAAPYDVERKGYRYDFTVRNQGSRRVLLSSGESSFPGLLLELPASLDPGEERPARAFVPSAATATGTFELRLVLPLILQ